MNARVTKQRRPKSTAVDTYGQMHCAVCGRRLFHSKESIAYCQPADEPAWAAHLGECYLEALRARGFRDPLYRDQRPAARLPACQSREPPTSPAPSPLADSHCKGSG